MISILYVFWMYVILFGVIGWLRGWVKELIVAFSVITALAANTLLRQYLPIVTNLDIKSSELFWIRVSILAALAFFGYQTVGVVPHLASKATRERVQEALFGMVLGAFNGYLIAGTILFYIDQAGYPFPDVISKPTGNLVAAIQTLMTFMPPRWLGVPWVYAAPIICLIFIVVVYI
ncbi:MAG TPA: CvpA family protein [Anaerolineales bacterium]|nr:CvpA family protein [Anaerolineales bacterium]